MDLEKKFIFKISVLDGYSLMPRTPKNKKLTNIADQTISDLSAIFLNLAMLFSFSPLKFFL